MNADHPASNIQHPASRPRPKRLALHALCALVLFVAASGANCRQWARQYTQPRTLPESATLDQIINRVNDNTSRVTSLQSTQATLRMAGAPALRTNVALQTPRRLRLTGSVVVAGPQLDLGSNDELFWLWIRQSEPPAMFVCRHDQFAMSSARQIMPVEPEWLIEAVGLPRFDPTQVHQGPETVGAGRVQIRSRKPSLIGDLTKITVIDEWDGTVIEQHLYDPQGQPLASALTSRHQRDPETGAALPRTIEVHWPTAQMSFTLEVNDWIVNRIPPENVALWTMPQPEGYPIVDLADPNLRFAPPSVAPPSAPAASHGVPPSVPATPPLNQPASTAPYSQNSQMFRPGTP